MRSTDEVPPRGLVLTALALGVVGLGIAAYLTVEHFTASTTLACPATTHINCAKVTSSDYSKVFGIPVAVAGLAYFAVLLPLLLPVAWRLAAVWVRVVRLAAVTAGLGFVLYLVWAELYRIDAICLWCTAVHVTTFLLFVVVVFAEAARAPAD